MHRPTDTVLETGERRDVLARSEFVWRLLGDFEDLEYSLVLCPAPYIDLLLLAVNPGGLLEDWHIVLARVAAVTR